MSCQVHVSVASDKLTTKLVFAKRRNEKTKHILGIKNRFSLELEASTLTKYTIMLLTLHQPMI